MSFDRSHLELAGRKSPIAEESSDISYALYSCAMGECRSRLLLLCIRTGLSSTSQKSILA